MSFVIQVQITKKAAGSTEKEKKTEGKRLLKLNHRERSTSLTKKETITNYKLNSYFKAKTRPKIYNSEETLRRFQVASSLPF